MAVMMTSRRSYDIPPTLPPRDHQTSIPASSANRNGRRESLDTPPPVPPITFRRRCSESAITPHVQPIPAHAESKTNPPVPVRTTSKINPRETPPTSRGTNEAPPPLPSRDNDMSQPHVLQRKSFETNSFVDRHTARAYSVGGHDRQPRDNAHAHRQRPPCPRESMPLPPPPQTDHPGPRRQLPTPTMDDVFEVQEDAAQAPPPSMPPRGRPTRSLGSSSEDFESRFFFHGVLDFPVPEPCMFTTKTYPSLTRETSLRDKGTSNQRKHQEQIGCL